ncbi:MAG: hypothetical protein ACHQUC_00525 [Chlamydiales bacterium]
MNTYGLLSINSTTFNRDYHPTFTYPKAARDVIITFLKIHNLTLNILGYISKVSPISGCVRIVSGCAMIATTLAVGDPNARKGVIINRWYSEALLTGVAQVARGVFEAFVPYGKFINAGLDIVGTVVNLLKIEYHKTCGCIECERLFDIDQIPPDQEPHPGPNYSLPLMFLNLV